MVLGLKREKGKKRNQWRERGGSVNRRRIILMGRVGCAATNQSGDDSKNRKRGGGGGGGSAEYGRWVEGKVSKAGSRRFLFDGPFLIGRDRWWLLPFANLFIDRTTGRRAFWASPSQLANLIRSYVFPFQPGINPLVGNGDACYSDDIVSPFFARYFSLSLLSPLVSISSFGYYHGT